MGYGRFGVECWRTRFNPSLLFSSYRWLTYSSAYFRDGAALRRPEHPNTISSKYNPIPNSTKQPFTNILIAILPSPTHHSHRPTPHPTKPAHRLPNHAPAPRSAERYAGCIGRLFSRYGFGCVCRERFCCGRKRGYGGGRLYVVYCAGCSVGSWKMGTGEEALVGRLV